MGDLWALFRAGDRIVKKVESILAALHGKLITGLITDEVVAQAILDKI